MNRPNISSSLEIRNIGYLINVAVTDWQRHKITLPLPQGVFHFSRCRNVGKITSRQRRGYGLAMSPNEVAVTSGRLSLLTLPQPRQKTLRRRLVSE